jgi:hypothetical protein
MNTTTLQVYTDLLRRAAEKEGPNSPTLFRAIQDIDDVLQVAGLNTFFLVLTMRPNKLECLYLAITFQSSLNICW